MLLLHTALALAPVCLGVAPQLQSSSTWDERVILLTDPLVVDPEARARAGWTVVINPPTKEPRSPLLKEDRVWDVRWDNSYPTVRYDSERRKFRLWHNAFIGGKAHPGWSPALGKPWHRGLFGLLYAESDDGVKFEKPLRTDTVSYPWNGTHETPPAGGTNLLLMTSANTDCGVIYDTHEANASRRYKALGTFYSEESGTSGLCRGKVRACE